MSNLQGPLVNNFEVPSWAGKPPPGLHLDVTKDGKMVQKLMIDEKKCYFFGRNKHLCDFTIDHQSCSRVHSALVWHKHLNRPFIIDLGSTHGTFIGSIRLDSKKPQAVPIDSEIHFGASTRRYVIRERPQTGGSVLDDPEGKETESEGNLFGLPETESELDNLTEFNTAHNRRVAQMVDLPDTPKNPLKRKRSASMRVRFNEDEDVINPEDVDPSVGRFRNLVQTQVIPTKKTRLEGGSGLVPEAGIRAGPVSLYDDLPVTHEYGYPSSIPGTYSIAAKLGLPIPNLAPDIEPMPHVQPIPQQVPMQVQDPNAPKEPRKKKYAKEAWPGRRPGPGLLV